MFIELINYTSLNTFTTTALALAALSLLCVVLADLAGTWRQVRQAVSWVDITSSTALVAEVEEIFVCEEAPEELTRTGLQCRVGVRVKEKTWEMVEEIIPTVEEVIHDLKREITLLKRCLVLAKSKDLQQEVRALADSKGPSGLKEVRDIATTLGMSTAGNRRQIVARILS